MLHKDDWMFKLVSMKKYLALFSLLFSIPFLGISQECHIHYQNVDVSEGLSSGYVNDITRDGNGFLWAATKDGVNRYDGRQVEVLRANPNDSMSLAFNDVTAVGAYDKGKLVLGGVVGKIQFLDLVSQKSNVLQVEQLKGRAVKHIEVADGIVYVATDRDLVLIEKSNQKVKSVNPLKNLGEIYFLEKDHIGMLWLSADNGLYIGRSNGGFKKLPKSENFDLIDIAGNNNESWGLSANGLYYIGSNLQPQRVTIENFELDNFGFKMVGVVENRVLLGGESNGFWVFDKKSNRIVNCSDFSGDYPYYTKINTFLNDKDGNVFLGTNGDGIMHFNLQSIFTPFGLVKLDKRKYYHSDAFFEDEAGLHVLAEERITVFNDAGGIERKVPLKSGFLSQVTDMVYKAPYYVISSYEGILLFDASGNEVDHLQYDDQDPLSIASNQVSGLQLFADRIWASSNKGLCEIDLGSGIVKRHLEGEYITDVSANRKRLLVSTNTGLYGVGASSTSPASISIEGMSTQGGVSITRVLEDKKTIWIGTKANGLFRTTQKSENAYVVNGTYLEKLSSPNITSMVVEESGNLWAATLMGLNLVFPVQGKVVTFYESDGLVSEVFDSRNAILEGDRAVFNSRRGLIEFNPRKVQMNHQPTQIVLTGVKISGADVYSEYETASLEKLEVNYSDYNFSLSFAALDFNAADKVRYVYQLEGLSDEWVDLGNSNEVTFSSLSEGTYTLRVKAYDSHGEESVNQLSLGIRITPPFYNTTWFRILAIALLLGVVGSFYLIRLQRARVRNRLLEREVEKRTMRLRQQNRELEDAKEKALASARAKSDFMATMSHEIRTPMNGILGSVSLLQQSEHSNEQDDQFNIIAECGDNMLAIINEILDYSQIEKGKMKPVVEEFDLIASLQATLDIHASRAHSKNLDFTAYIAPRVPRKVRSDKSRISQLLNNVVSNSVKFTRKGHVSVEVDLKEGRSDGTVELLFKVADTGIGIPKDKQNEIWEAFSQADTSSTREFGGTGLGLTICKSIAKIMGGEIWMESEEGKGSTFYITLPIEAKERSTKHHARSQQKVLFATSSSQVNEMLSKYASEVGLEHKAFTDLQSMSSYNDAEKYDVAFLDQRALTYEFAEDLSVMAKKVYLLSPKANQLAPEDKLPKGITGVLSLQLWRYQFEALFVDRTKSQEERPKADAENMEGLGNMRILLAEDNKVNQMVTRKIFKKLGLTLEIAENGQIAVEMQQKRDYDIILMDLLMPEMDGMEATAKIRELDGGSKPYIVAFSANIFNQEKSHFEEKGFNGVLSKPAKLNDVSAILKEAQQAISV